MVPLLFLNLLFFSLSTSCGNKLIYCVAPPRTLSTIFLRAMHARGDVIVFNEPSQYAFLADYKPRVLPEIFESAPPHNSYEKVRERLLEAREISNVCAKDICCAAYYNLYEQDEFLADPDIIFLFLIRNPHESAISNYKALGNKVSSTGLDWLIYEHLYLLFEKITHVRGKAPLVLCSEDLTKDPGLYMQLLCEEIDLPAQSICLSWPSLAETFDPSMWNDTKTYKESMKWHENAIKSTCFLDSNRHYEVDESGNPTFVEVNLADRGHIKKVYERYMFFYEKLYQFRLKVDSI